MIPSDVLVRPASTVLVVADGEDGLLTLLLQRTHDAVFLPGHWVFPGGRVDDQDFRSASRTTSESPDGLTAERYAAARECFEEAGLLIGCHPTDPTDPADLADLADPTPVDLAHAAELRRSVIADDCTFPAALDELGTAFRPERLRYLGRWVTPVGPPRRFATHFFVAFSAVAPAGPSDARLGAAVGDPASPDGQELIDHRWLRPADALTMPADLLPIIEPTAASLEAVAGYSSVAELLGALDVANRALVAGASLRDAGLGGQMVPLRN